MSMEPADPIKEMSEELLSYGSAIPLSLDHIAAVNRSRNVILNYDSVAFCMPHLEGEEMIASMLGSSDLRNSPVESIFWNWGEGNFASYPSKVLEPATVARFPRWAEEGYDIIQECHDAAKARGLESFFSYRINGGDNDRHEHGRHQVDLPRFKEKHPEMLIYDSDSQLGLHTPRYNFAYEEVRDHKLAILAEVFARYDFDGLEIDFQRAPPVLPLRQQWEHRSKLTAFMQSLRKMLQDRAEKIGHPILVAVRIPTTIYGCHSDGIDIERWVRDQLVDILVLGPRSYEHDYRGFLDLARDRNIKVYPCIDEIHSTDGYRNPPLEVFRGVFTNWAHQGFDGFQTFNWQNNDPCLPMGQGKDLDDWLDSQWRLHKRVYEELGSGIEDLDKTFVIQRRLGGHFINRKLDAAKWKTPREGWGCQNVEAQLPAMIPEDADQDLFLHLYVGDTATDYGKRTLTILLSDTPDDQIKTLGAIHLAVQLRINGVLYTAPDESDGAVCVWKLDDEDVFAEGDNLIQVAHSQRYGRPNVWVEKVELELRSKK